MEKGNAAQFKNRNLEEIDINMNDVVEDEYIPENPKKSPEHTITHCSLPETGCESLEREIANTESCSYQDNGMSHVSTFKVSDTESSSESEKGDDDYLLKIVKPNIKGPNRTPVKKSEKEISK
nr:unnamed protein product [Callosobruchus analis]